jgi:exopolysaccharide biosynthesis protein
MGSSYVSTDYYRLPKTGADVSFEYYLVSPDSEGFSLAGMESIVSGGPRLVRYGSLDYTLDEGFKEARFTTASSPRTAIGTTYDGKLLMVSTASATIQQMRELMLSLGCENAMNLDGGASCAMYYNGSLIRTPGRELTTTLQVFVN